MLNVLVLNRTLAGIALRTRRPGPSAEQWVEALAAVAVFPPPAGSYRTVTLTLGGTAHVEEHPLPGDEPEPVA
ncbi:hypothetical protein [Methylobacterium soli]|uniref:Uncharacterized protein n=1 Tax=Methylobacterium soli TaxID=553447 RepID=A0A6L3SRU5_9HYPH|nr:hypothetical protein [Methylobacterium soli]KAB1075449.1 hypothetical protein F6X53_25130 [Methylobacterium soli]GJE45452.1 hypothetical protein AEGHOMDF_4647 [Methylobacterium soli]